MVIGCFGSSYKTQPHSFRAIFLHHRAQCLPSFAHSAFVDRMYHLSTTENTHKVVFSCLTKSRSSEQLPVAFAFLPSFLFSNMSILCNRSSNSIHTMNLAIFHDISGSNLIGLRSRYRKENQA